MGYYENEKCFYMPWGLVGEWGWLGDDFVELSPPPYLGRFRLGDIVLNR